MAEEQASAPKTPGNTGAPQFPSSLMVKTTHLAGEAGCLPDFLLGLVLYCLLWHVLTGDLFLVFRKAFFDQKLVA